MTFTFSTSTSSLSTTPPPPPRLFCIFIICWENSNVKLEHTRGQYTDHFFSSLPSRPDFFFIFIFIFHTCMDNVISENVCIVKCVCVSVCAGCECVSVCGRVGNVYGEVVNGGAVYTDVSFETLPFRERKPHSH